MNAFPNVPATAEPSTRPERRITPDRRTDHSILCQEALARIIAETRGQDSYAGRALAELETRRRAATDTATGDEEIIIYSLRGQWLVGTVHEIRQAMLAAASAACRRRASRPDSSIEQTSQPGRHGEPDIPGATVG